MTESLIPENEMTTEKLVSIFNSAFYDATRYGNPYIVVEENGSTFVTPNNKDSLLNFEIICKLDTSQVINFNKITNEELGDIRIEYGMNFKGNYVECLLDISYKQGLYPSQIIHTYRNFKKVSETVFSKIENRTYRR